MLFSCQLISSAVHSPCCNLLEVLKVQKKTYSHCNRTHAQPFGAAKQILSGRIKSCIWQKLVDGFLEKKTREDFIPSRVFCGDYILRQSCPEQKPFVDVIFSVQIRDLAPHQRLIFDGVSPFLFFLLIAAEILPLVLEKVQYSVY